MADSGLGATITFGTSGFTANIESIEFDDIERGVRDCTHLGSTGFMEFEPEDLLNAGGFSFTWQYVSDSNPPYDQAVETVTVSFPLKGSEVTAANITGTGFMDRFKLPNLDKTEKMLANGHVTWDGGTGPSFTAGSNS